MTTYWVLIVLITNQWTIAPVKFPDEATCEQGYSVVVDTFKDENLPAPDHRCVKITTL